LHADKRSVSATFALPLILFSLILLLARQTAVSPSVVPPLRCDFSDANVGVKPKLNRPKAKVSQCLCYTPHSGDVQPVSLELCDVCSALASCSVCDTSWVRTPVSWLRLDFTKSRFFQSSWSGQPYVVLTLTFQEETSRPVRHTLGSEGLTATPRFSQIRAAVRYSACLQLDRCGVGRQQIWI
jgi:hypothetical protein